MHLHEVQVGRFRVNQMENNLELRVDYLDGVITEEDFMVKVQRANKQHEKRREIGEILALFMHTAREIFLRMQEYVTTNRANSDAAVIKIFLDEFEGIRLYANECLIDISKTYNCQLKAIEYYNCNAGRRFVTGDDTKKTITSRDVLFSL